MKNLLAIGITGTLLYLGFKAFGLNRFNVYSVVRTPNGVTRGNWMGLEISKPIAPFNVLNGQEISYRYSGYYLISNGIWCSTSLYKVANENVTIPVFGLSVQF